MRPFAVLLLATVLLASGCSTGQQETGLEEGATYVYSVEGEGLDSGYSMTFSGEEGDVQEFRVEAEVRGEPVNGSFSVNKSSLDYVKEDNFVNAIIFDYLSGYSIPFPFVFWDVRPGEMERVVNGEDVQKQGYSLSHERSLDSYKGFEAVNISISRWEGTRVSYYVVSTERPHLLLSASTDSGYEVRLESVEN